MSATNQKKSGFKIDDILEQQHNETWCQYEPSNKPTELRVPVQGNFDEYHDPVTLTRWPYLNARPDSVNFDALYSANLPFYQHMLDLQKTSPIVPLPFSVPNPATYLEQYGNVMDKGFPGLPTFYAHPYPAYFIPTGGSKRKGGQIRFTPQQTRSLENRFASAKYLSPEDRRHLAIQLKLSDRQVKTWFQNRRAKHRRSNNGMSCSALQESSVESKCNLSSRIGSRSPSASKDAATTDDESSSIDNYEDKQNEKITMPSAAS